MALPNPIPDNPTRWDGWKDYNSENFYERLCLDFDSNPNAEQIEENCRQLLVWWQKKLPLKNQPSNPARPDAARGAGRSARPARGGAHRTARSGSRAQLDAQLRGRIVGEAVWRV